MQKKVLYRSSVLFFRIFLHYFTLFMVAKNEEKLLFLDIPKYVNQRFGRKFSNYDSSGGVHYEAGNGRFHPV